MKYDTIVVGAGLFGCFIARQLRSLGQRVLLVDTRMRDRGSEPAACLMKPGWLSSLGSDELSGLLALIKSHYGLQSINFQTQVLRATAVFWTDPKNILSEPERVSEDFIHGEMVQAQRIDADTAFWSVSGRGVGRIWKCSADRLVLAAGSWTEMALRRCSSEDFEIEPSPTVIGQAGVAFLFPELHIQQPFIKVWAPYKQIVAFNRGDGLWIGDGSSILAKNWHHDRTLQCLNRCTRALEDVGFHTIGNSDHRTLYGIRPYVKEIGKAPAYLKRHAPGLWVATGGAKNGTIGAAWCAQELGRAFSLEKAI